MNRFILSASTLITIASALSAQITVRQVEPAFTTPGVWFESTVTGAGVVGTADLTGAGGDLENGQPLPTGAGLLTTQFDNGDRAHVGVADSYGQMGDILATLQFGYSSYKASNAGQNAAASPSLKITISDANCNDPSSAGDCYGQLIFEPYWNQVGHEGTSFNPPLDTWQSWSLDADTGLFWWSGGFGQANSAGGPPLRTLNEWLGVFNSDFPTADLLLVEIGVGSYNQGQVGYFDDVSISHSRGTGYSVSYDFEAFFDCNSNSIHDPDEVMGGSALDCNGNGIPDECDIASGSSVDCQPNGIPDDCESDVATIVNEFGPPELLPGTTALGVWFDLFLNDQGASTTVDLTGLGGALEIDQPAPVGCALISTVTGVDRVNVGYREDFGHPTQTFPSMLLGYSTHKASNPGQNANAAPSLKLEVFNFESCPLLDDCYGTLVFEPYRNQPGFVGGSVPPPLDTWQDWSITGDQGVWWWTGGFGQPGTAGSGPHRTLNEWKALFDLDANFADARITSVQVGMGNGQGGVLGYFDSVRVQHSFGAGYSDCFDFEGIDDCNNNGVHDARDISEGTSQDCNSNGLPDDCEIAAATSDDCNNNGIPDECELASSLVYGSGVNPSGSLVVLSGEPAIGTTVQLGLHNPVGTQSAPAVPFLFVAAASDPNFPAGTPIPNFGMSAPGATGELLISLAPPNPLAPVLSGGAWLGSPVTISVPIPMDCSLVGQDYFGQGILVDGSAALAQNRFGLTDGVRFSIGF